MSFNIENFGADASNIKSILGGANYYRYFNKDNNTLTTPGYFPADLGLAVGDRIKVIPSVKTNPDELYVVTSTANRTVTVTQIDTDGAVDSVNGKTGNVVLDASDVGALPDSTVIPDAIQVSALPTASADEEGKIYQFIGTTDASYTNGYFYKCVSDSQNPATYSWVQTSVQPAPSGLPDQTGQSGKFLVSDGTNASWDRKVKNNITISDYNDSNKWVTLLCNWELGVGMELLPSSSGGQSFQLGKNNYYLTNLFTQKIQAPSGNPITVPTTGGTMVVATPPTADGTYVLKATVSSGVVTLTWVAE